MQIVHCVILICRQMVKINAFLEKAAISLTSYGFRLLQIPFITSEEAAEKIIETIQTNQNVLLYPKSEAGIMVTLKR